MVELKIQKLEGVVIHTLPANNGIQYIVGKSEMGVSALPREPYSAVVCEFLNELSNTLMSDPMAKQYPDVISFAYWCRKANIAKLKQDFSETHLRLGLGLVFHITPSNVPVNFAFSYVFSLLAGNANVVRVPTKGFPQTDVLCRAFGHLLEQEKYWDLAAGTCFIKYNQNDDITSYFSEMCNGRIIWGGDQTIKNIRKMPISVRGVEVAFADRYSFCVVDASSLSSLDDNTLSRLATSFYNDVYLMDQNACSSPHLIVWLNASKNSPGKQRFWDAVHEIVASKYELHPVNAIDKYVLLCGNAIELNGISGFKRHENYLYRIELDTLPDQLDSFRGKYGYFYEYNAEDMDNLSTFINARYQTLTYFGLDRLQLRDFVLKNRLSGIDRIVPIGSALDIGVVWDGYDIVRTLSRIVDCK